jgi:hypothetical protein
MSRWDERKYDENNDLPDHEEEMRLLKKFHDYKELERIEKEKSRFSKTKLGTKIDIWSSRFIVAAITQGLIIATVTGVLIFLELFYSDIQLTQLLSTSFFGSTKLFFFGYIIHITLIVILAVSAIFSNYLETNMKKLFQVTKMF